jgi:hypothetical protein
MMVTMNQVAILTPFSGGKAEQHEDEQLATPPRQVFFEHRDAALPVRTVFGHASVDRQGAEEREQYENKGGDGGQGVRGQEGNARLIAERREIVDAGETHHLPPRGLMNRVGVGPGGLAQAFEKPEFETPFPAVRQTECHQPT